MIFYLPSTLRTFDIHSIRPEYNNNNSIAIFSAYLVPLSSYSMAAASHVAAKMVKILEIFIFSICLLLVNTDLCRDSQSGFSVIRNQSANNDHNSLFGPKIWRSVPQCVAIKITKQRWTWYDLFFYNEEIFIRSWIRSKDVLAGEYQIAYFHNRWQFPST